VAVDEDEDDVAAAAGFELVDSDVDFDSDEEPPDDPADALSDLAEPLLDSLDTLPERESVR